MSKQDPNLLPEKVVELMVQQVLKKNGVKTDEVKNNVSDEQKQMLKDMVEDLRKQVEQFNAGEKNTKKTSD